MYLQKVEIQQELLILGLFIILESIYGHFMNPGNFLGTGVSQLGKALSSEIGFHLVNERLPKGQRGSGEALLGYKQFSAPTDKDDFARSL